MGLEIYPKFTPTSRTAAGAHDVRKEVYSMATDGKQLNQGELANDKTNHEKLITAEHEIIKTHSALTALNCLLLEEGQVAGRTHAAEVIYGVQAIVEDRIDALKRVMNTF